MNIYSSHRKGSPVLPDKTVGKMVCKNPYPSIGREVNSHMNLSQLLPQGSIISGISAKKSFIDYSLNLP